MTKIINRNTYRIAVTVILSIINTIGFNKINAGAKLNIFFLKK